MERSNPHAYSKNGIKLYYPKAAGETILYPNILYTVAADGSTTDVEILNASGADYITVKISDKNGAYAVHKFDPVATADTQTIDTSALDASCEWVIRVYAGIEPDVNGCNSANSDYCVTVCSPQGATGNTVPEGAQALFVALTDNASTEILFDEGYIAPESTFALGEYTAGNDLILDIAGWGDALSVQGVEKGLTVSNITITGDVTSFTNNTPLTGDGVSSLPLADAVTLNIALAGSYSAVVTVFSSDNGYPQYKFTLTWTVV